jgi:hypothetical protein
MPYTAPTIDEYLLKRLMPVEGMIPHLPGIEMYGDSIPAGTVGGDLFEYINFQQRYDIDARIQRALKLSKEFLLPLRPGELPCNSVDDHLEWMKSKPAHLAVPAGWIFIRPAHDGCLRRPAGVKKQRRGRFDQLHAQYRAERRNFGCDHVACTPKSTPSVRSRRVHAVLSFQ